MATVKGGVSPSIGFTQTPATGFLTGVPLPIGLAAAVNFAASTAADGLDLIYAAKLTFTASTPQTLNLQSLTDIVGGAVALARVRCLIVQPLGTTDAATLTLSPNASNGWTSLIGASSSLVLKMATSTNSLGAFAIFVAPNTTGWTVGASNKSLDLTPSAHGFDVNVVIAGASA